MKRNRNAKTTTLGSIPLTMDRDTSMRDYMRDSLREYKLSPEELKATNDRLEKLLGPKPTKKHHSMIIPKRQRGGAA